MQTPWYYLNTPYENEFFIKMMDIWRSSSLILVFMISNHAKAGVVKFD